MTYPRKRKWLLQGLLLLTALFCWPSLVAAETDADRVWVVGSKNFTESYILGELIAQTLEASGRKVQRRFGLGGTLICYEALKKGEIDVYAEYTGTISQAILQLPEPVEIPALNEQLAQKQLAMLPPLGFNNTYAVAMRKSMAQRLNIKTISDLKQHPRLRLALSHEFMKRPEDGWEALKAAYALPFKPVGIEHGLAYKALVEKQIDVTDAYSTDGEIIRYQLHLATDEKAFFPAYLAVPLVRLEDVPLLSKMLAVLENGLNEELMQAMNAKAEHLSFSEIIRQYRQPDASPSSARPLQNFVTILIETWPLLVRHIQLSGLAMLFACLFGIPLAIAVHSRQRLTALVLQAAGLLQTIPAIAFLALLIPLLGIGVVPAIITLFFYSLLPILRNTILGLTTVDAKLIRISKGMGMTDLQRIRHVTFPLSLPSILAGLRTAAVISIGTATLAAFIGAGGLGEPVITGLALNDTGLILRGAIPAALLAVLTELFFGRMEVLLIPEHLRRVT